MVLPCFFLTVLQLPLLLLLRRLRNTVNHLCAHRGGGGSRQRGRRPWRPPVEATRSAADTLEPHGKKNGGRKGSQPTFSVRHDDVLRQAAGSRNIAATLQRTNGSDDSGGFDQIASRRSDGGPAGWERRWRLSGGKCDGSLTLLLLTSSLPSINPAAPSDSSKPPTR